MTNWHTYPPDMPEAGDKIVYKPIGLKLPCDYVTHTVRYGEGIGGNFKEWCLKEEFYDTNWDF